MTFDRAKELGEAWETLSERALDREPFLTPQWFLAWWSAFGSETMKLLTVRLHGELIGVAPFQVTTERVWGHRWRVLRLWSNLFSNRAHVVLHQSHRAAAANALIETLYSGPPDWDIARIGPVLRDSDATRALSDALSAAGKHWGMRDVHGSPYVRLPRSWDSLTDRLSGSSRRSLRRKERNAEKSGRVGYFFAGGSPEDVEHVFRIEAKTWKHAAGTGLGSQPEVERFYRTVASEACRQGWLRLAFLTVDGKPISYEFNVQYQKVLYNLKLGYDIEYAHLSPGLVLKQKVLRQAIRDGLEEYDLLGIEEPYKMKWTDEARPLQEFWFYRPGVSRRVAHFLFFDLRKRLAGRFPWLIGMKHRLGALLRPGKQLRGR